MGLKKTKVGKVVRVSGEKTLSVVVETRRPHPLYQKVVRYSKKYLVHCVDDTISVGDDVVITECRPLSKRKRWRVVARKAEVVS
ncbi:30S ribosomal protein S17 [Candidatus Marinamargulisbacteria bacterium]|jgi:small subunit ribosomal protein S17|nr:30S ribosomal protein S17 [Candidatus Marinamargulisbacteria bacterium]